nr:hypothetical protein [Clostridium sp. Marseille-P7770]
MEEKILEFCKEYFKQHGYAPSSREIGDGVGLWSTSSVNLHMNRLYDQGLIASDHRGLPRAFRVVGMSVVDGNRRN